MADISAIRSAIASRLTTLVGNTGNSYTYWQAEPSSPCFHIVGFGTEYDYTFGTAAGDTGGDTLTCTVQGVASRGLDEAAQRQIDDWCDTAGSTSVKAAIETERPSAVTLGGTVASCRVSGHSRPAIQRFDDGTEAWTVDFTLEIVT